jgi:hypothetical protein
MDENGVLFFGLISELSLACWNSKHFPEFGGKNIETLVINPDTLQFPSGLKVCLNIVYFIYLIKA